ncbi:MAG: CatB-related O-acetyltransferase [Bacteroidales bacterium]|nr:CatB-related O-acetyltransferase [Bacteroidales bacterium]
MFIGANVVILNGVKIGNGAVIGAGAVVAQDVPDYAIVGGVPAKIIRYRFPDSQVNELQKIQWWNFSDDKLKMVEQYFYDTDKFISECKCQ